MALGVLVFALASQLRTDYSDFFAPESAPYLIWALLNIVLPLFSVLLIVGLCSRISLLICWAGVIAVQQANPHIIYGADRLLHLLLFWAIFLPVEATWSLDSRWFKQPYSLPISERWASWAITLQICFVYWSSVLSKTDPLWTQNHNALFYVLSLDDSTTSFGSYLLQYPALLRLLTVGTMCLEFFGPFLLFIPWHRDRFRMAAVILFLIFHLIGMQSMLILGFFPWVCAAAWLIFLPAFFWDFVSSSFSDSCAAPFPKGWLLFLDRGLVGLVLISFVDVVAWNVVQVADLRMANSTAVAWMNAHDPTVPVLHLNQRWRMYAPGLPADHGWMVIPAELDDGTKLDLFTRRPVSWNQPDDIPEYLGDDRWRYFLGDLIYTRDSAKIGLYCQTLVDKWNADHPAGPKVKSVIFVFMKRTTLPDLTISKPEPVRLYTKSY